MGELAGVLGARKKQESDENSDNFYFFPLAPFTFPISIFYYGCSPLYFL